MAVRCCTEPATGLFGDLRLVRYQTGQFGIELAISGSEPSIRLVWRWNCSDRLVLLVLVRF